VQTTFGIFKMAAVAMEDEKEKYNLYDTLDFVNEK
jgi:hypothetical protein